MTATAVRVQPPTEVQTLADGLFFGEAPRWHDGRLWFSDFYAHAVKSVSVTGDVRTECEIDDQPSGLGWMPDGSLLVVAMRKRQILRRSVDGMVRVHADLSHLAAFHCNDMIVDRSGRAYVGEYGFDIDAGLKARGTASVFADHPTASISIVEADGTARHGAKGLHFPNGVAIMPDGNTLLVGETLAGCLTAFDIADGGSLTNRRVWAPLLPRVADGIAIDGSGAVWVANPLGAECVRVGAGGEVLQTIATTDPCFACALGGADGRTLFMMTAQSADEQDAIRQKTGRILTTGVEVAG